MKLRPVASIPSAKLPRAPSDMVRSFSAITEQIARGETSGGYEDALAGLLATHHFTAVPTEGEPWVEADFIEDLVRARELFG